MYRPAGQSVHEVEAIVEYLPAAQMSHDVLEKDEFEVLLDMT